MVAWLSTTACTAEEPTSPPPSEFCTGGGIKAVVEVFTDKFFSETSWDIQDVNGTVVASGGGYTAEDTLYVDTVCLEETEGEECGGADYFFTIYDLYGDGICCFQGRGYYNVYIQDELKANGGEFEFNKTSPLCITKTPPPSSAPSEYCGDGLHTVVTVYHDLWSSLDINVWEITDASGNRVANFGVETPSYQKIVTKLCLEKTESCGGADYYFTIYDYSGNGICCEYGYGFYTVLVEGELKATGGDFEREETTHLCKCYENKSRKVCNQEFGCVWEKDVEGVGSCVPTADNCDKQKKRKPCLEVDGCFWKNTGEGTGRCKVCSSLSKKKACEDQQECTWEDNMCM